MSALLKPSSLQGRQSQALLEGKASLNCNRVERTLTSTVRTDPEEESCGGGGDEFQPDFLSMKSLTSGSELVSGMRGTHSMNFPRPNPSQRSLALSPAENSS